MLNDFPSALTRAVSLDAGVTEKAYSIISVPEYSDLISLATRQALSNTELTIGIDANGKLNKSDVMLFLRQGDEQYK
jgi:hypothetical protein